MMHAVIGAGAVGCSIGGLLLNNNQKLVMLGRRSSSKSISMNGKLRKLDVSTLEEKYVAHSQYIWLCVKAFDVEKTIDCIESFVNPGTKIFVLSNGFIAPSKVIVGSKIDFGSVYFGADSLNSRDFVLHTENPRVCFGYDTEDRIAGLDFVDVVNDIQFLRAKKWCLNTVMNTLCAVHGYENNGQLRSHSKSEILALVSEVSKLSAHVWRVDFSNAELTDALFDAIDLFATNENSMATDLRLSRRHEGSYLSGVVRGLDGYPTLNRLDQRLQSIS